MATKDPQTLSLKFDQVMFDSLVFTWERNFAVAFVIFSVLVTQINLLESYLDIYTLFNVCSVHRGMFSTSGGIQNIEEIP